MSVSNMVKNLYVDTNQNKNVGTVAYVFHRITGIGLVVYLLLHTYVLSSATKGSESFSSRMSLVQNPFFAVLEVALIAGVFFHMFNGLRITLCDFFNWPRQHKLFFWIEIVLFAAIMIITLYLQWPKFFAGYYPGGGN